MANRPDELPQILDDLAAGCKVIDDRHADYVKAKAYKEGDVKEMTGTNRLIRKVLTMTAESHKLAFAGIPVTALFDKINLSGITTDNEAATKAIADAFERDDLEDEADDYQVKAGMFGDYYLIIDPLEQDESGKATDLTTVGASPLSSAMVYSKKDNRTARFGVRRWKAGTAAAPEYKALVYYDDCTVALTSATEKPEMFEPDYEYDENGVAVENSHIVPHLGGHKLLVHFAVDDKPYGRPVHINAYGPQDAINKKHATSLANDERIGWPSRYAIADPKASVEDDDLGEDFGDDGLPVDTDHPVTGTGADGQSNVTGDRSRSLADEPGAITKLFGVTSVGTFAAASNDGFIAGLDWEVRAMATLTGTPIAEFDESANPPSGVARRLANTRINNHAKKVIRSLSRSWRTWGETVLAVQGIPAAKVVVAYEPVQTETDSEGLALVTAKVKAGVPIARALVEAGYPEADVSEWWPDESALLPPDLWPPFAEAVAKLTTASALGAPVNLADLFGAYMSGITREPAPTPAPVPAPVVEPPVAE